MYQYRDKFRDKALEELLREDGEPDPEAWYTTLTELLKCRGCDSVTVCRKTWVGEEETSEGDLRRLSVAVAPIHPRLSHRIDGGDIYRPPKWLASAGSDGNESRT
jgi:hypothetical protein